MWLTCVFSYKVACLAQKGMINGILLYLFIHYQLCVYGSMIQGIEWQRDCHEILKKAQVELSIGSNWKPWDWIMVFVASLVLSVFYDLFVLDLQVCLCLVQGLATLFVVSYFYWFFMVFFLFAFVLSFYVSRVLGIGWEGES